MTDLSEMTSPRAPRGIPLPPTSCQVVEKVICRLRTHIYKSPHLLIAGAGRERCRSDFTVTREGYPCFTLEFVASGKGSICLGASSGDLLPGHLFLYGPHIPLTVRTDPATPMLKYYIEFFGGDARKLFPAGIINPGEIRRISDIGHIADLFEHLLSAARSMSSVQQAICAAYLNLILLKTADATAELPSGVSLK